MTASKVRVQPGPYLFRGIRGKDGWAYPPCEVELIGLGRHVTTHQEQCCYLTANGLFFCERNNLNVCRDWKRRVDAAVKDVLNPPVKGLFDGEAK